MRPLLAQLVLDPRLLLLLLSQQVRHLQQTLELRRVRLLPLEHVDARNQLLALLLELRDLLLELSRVLHQGVRGIIDRIGRRRVMN